jgi:hypothetical protein
MVRIDIRRNSFLKMKNDMILFIDLAFGRCIELYNDVLEKDLYQ